MTVADQMQAMSDNLKLSWGPLSTWTGSAVQRSLTAVLNLTNAHRTWSAYMTLHLALLWRVRVDEDGAGHSCHNASQWMNHYLLPAFKACLTWHQYKPIFDTYTSYHPYAFKIMGDLELAGVKPGEYSDLQTYWETQIARAGKLSTGHGHTFSLLNAMKVVGPQFGYMRAKAIRSKNWQEMRMQLETVWSGRIPARTLASGLKQERRLLQAAQPQQQQLIERKDGEEKQLDASPAGSSASSEEAAAAAAPAAAAPAASAGGKKQKKGAVLKPTALGESGSPNFYESPLVHASDEEISDSDAPASVSHTGRAKPATQSSFPLGLDAEAAGGAAAGAAGRLPIRKAKPIMKSLTLFYAPQPNTNAPASAAAAARRSMDQLRDLSIAPGRDDVFKLLKDPRFAFGTKRGGMHQLTFVGNANLPASCRGSLSHPEVNERIIIHSDVYNHLAVVAHPVWVVEFLEMLKHSAADLFDLRKYTVRYLVAPTTVCSTDWMAPSQDGRATEEALVASLYDQFEVHTLHSSIESKVITRDELAQLLEMARDTQHADHLPGHHAGSSVREISAIVMDFHRLELNFYEGITLLHLSEQRGKPTKADVEKAKEILKQNSKVSAAERVACQF
jgi:hypothetical protein